MLCIGVFVLVLLYLGMRYLTAPPIYTAQATIAPPNPSPVSALMSGMSGGSGGVSSSVRRLIGGGGGTSGGNDPFTEFTQLLVSYRLASELAEKDGLLQDIYSNEWDPAAKTWKPKGWRFGVTSGIKKLTHVQVSDHPTADALEAYLDGHLSMSQAKIQGMTGVNVMSVLNGSSYLMVSFDYDNPVEAERLLGVILARADDIIRQEQLKDVVSRISFIRAELPNVTQAEQREALIQLLSSQEQMRIMMVADKRYAVSIISPPHAGLIPSNFQSPISLILKSLFLAAAICVVLALLEPRVRVISWLFAVSRRGSL